MYLLGFRECFFIQVQVYLDRAEEVSMLIKVLSVGAMGFKYTHDP